MSLPLWRNSCTESCQSKIWSILKVESHMRKQPFFYRNSHFLNNEETMRKKRVNKRSCDPWKCPCIFKRDVYDYCVTKMGVDNCKSIIWFNCYELLRNFDILLLRWMNNKQLCIYNLTFLVVFRTVSWLFPRSFRAMSLYIWAYI